MDMIRVQLPRVDTGLFDFGPIAIRGNSNPWPSRHVVGLDGSTPAPFHLGQAWTMDSARRITAMLAGSQGGKTGLGPWWLWQEIQRKRGGRLFAVTASYDLFKLKMLRPCYRCSWISWCRALLGAEIGSWNCA